MRPCSVPLSRYWGKLKRDQNGDVVARLSVADHCADVAACFRALLSSQVVRARLAALAGVPAFDEQQLARLTVLAALHDIGKYNRGFQNRALTRAPFVAGHVRELLALWNATNGDGERLADALGMERMRAWGAEESTLDDLLVAGIAHHGCPYMLAGQLARDARHWRAEGSLDPFTAIGAHAELVTAWLPEAFETGGAPLPAAVGLQHAFNGLLTLADWIGSDTHFFPFDRAIGPERFAWAAARAARALRATGLDTRTARDSLGRRRPEFRVVFERDPYPMQRIVAELPTDARGAITVLESETGSGKTEAAIARFLSLFHAGVVDGMYFALPTRTSAVQIHERVRRAIERAFPSSDVRPAVVLAVPGCIRADDRQARRLAPFDVRWDDEDPEHWRERGWAAERPKRYLAGPIVVGTVDQVLLSTLTVPHAHLRAMSLARHLLVVDEVHASDAYMTRLLEDVLERHLRGSGHALLMSATLGGAARERLLAPGTRAVPPSLAEAEAVSYPMVAHRESARDAISTQTFRGGRARSISVCLSPIAADAGAVARRALDAARRGACVLVLRNTVRECIETQQELEAIASPDDAALLLTVAGLPTPHHSRYAREDRAELDEAIGGRFGRERTGVGCVAVATQTVQQSLDIDADLLLTDLCPVDVLLQRIGRLHRHAGRTRPRGFEAPVAIVLTPPERDLAQFIRPRGDARGPHGIGTVYADLSVLEATWRLAEAHPRWDVPTMSRALVERATHPEALRALETELGGVWEVHGHATRGKLFAHRRLASLNLVSWDTPFPDCQFPTGEMSREVRTRLGSDDRIASFDPVVASPFGKEMRELSIPGHLVRGAAPDAQPRSVERDDRQVRFQYGDRWYAYDRLGLRPFTLNTTDDDETGA